jgi:hypothetical protein
MVLIDYCGMSGDKYLYRYFYKDKIKIFEFNGGENAFIDKIQKIKSYILLQVYEDFLSNVNECFPEENPIHSFNEAKSKIREFITWGYENDHQVENIINYSLKSIKRANIIINEIPDTHKIKKTLIFLIHCVTLTAKHRITF